MKKACVAVIDSAHARLFMYEETDGEGPVLNGERTLTSEHHDEKGMFTDRAGMNPGIVGSGGNPGGHHSEAGHRGGHGSVDDHRIGHLAELDARFAKQIVEELTTCVREKITANIIIVASPKMLGVVRGYVAPLTKAGASLTEVDENLGNLTLAQIQEKLAKLEIIKPRMRFPSPGAHGAGAR